MKPIQRRNPSNLFHPLGRGLLLFWAVLLVFGIAGLPARARVQPAADSGVTDSGIAGVTAARPQAAEDLRQWLRSHAETGGTYTLTENVDWPGEYIYMYKKTEIRMNGYGIRVRNGFGAVFHGPVTFTGGESSVPMFTIEPGAGLGFNESVKIEVTNGCAIYVKGNCINEGRSDCRLSFNFASIAARGNEAAAIKVEGNADLCFLRMCLSEGARGIEAAGNIHLAVSEIDAMDGESLQARGSITLDASNVTPWIADPLPRMTVPYAPTSPIFISREEDTVFPVDITIQLRRDGADTLTLMRALHYNGKQIPSEAGVYQLTAYPEQLPFAYPTVIFPPVIYNVIVPEQNRFYLKELLVIQDNICHFALYPNACEVNAVLVSENSGSTWTNLPHKKGAFSLEGFSPGIYWFQLKLNVPDGINPMTSIMELELDENGITMGNIISGDRDDSHRDDLTAGVHFKESASDASMKGGSGEKIAPNAADSINRDFSIRIPQTPDSASTGGMENHPAQPNGPTGSPDKTPPHPTGSNGRALSSAASAASFESVPKEETPRPGFDSCSAPDDGPAVPASDKGSALWVPLLFLAAAATAGAGYLRLALRGLHQ